MVAFLSALVVVKAFLGYVSRHSFAAFAWYRIVFGALLLLLAHVSAGAELHRFDRGRLDHGRLHQLARAGRAGGHRGRGRRADSGARLAGPRLALAAGRTLAQRAVPAARLGGSGAAEPAASAWRVADALEAVGPGLRVALKWPNDLMRRRPKVGGILCEARWQGESLAWVAVGLGLNVTNAIRTSCAARRTRSASTCPDVTPEAILPRAIVDALRGARMPRGGPARRRRSSPRSERATGSAAGELRAPLAGRADGIADDGALLVRRRDGVPRGGPGRPRSSWPSRPSRRSFEPCSSLSTSATPRSPLGLFQGDTLEAHWRLTTNPDRTPDEWGGAIGGFLVQAGHSPNEVRAVCLASVAPAVTQSVVDGVARATGCTGRRGGRPLPAAGRRSTWTSR